MNIRQAILRAADQIERNPDTFNFLSTDVPGSCGTPGCALGWIGHFMGRKGVFNEVCDVMTLSVLGSVTGDRGEFDFYRRMDALHGFAVWRDSAAKCASAMRLYADKYHPQEGIEEVRRIPADIRAIFDMTPAELQRELA